MMMELNTFVEGHGKTITGAIREGYLNHPAEVGGEEI